MFQQFSFNHNMEIIFGVSAVKNLPSKVKQFNANKVMLVTDEGLTKTDSFKIVRECLDQSNINYHIYSEVEPDPTIEIVDNGAAILKEKACELVIGFGGGSSIDTAKGIAVCATNEGSIKNYFGKGKVKNPGMPIIAIPTTAGTGSEVSALASIKDKVTQSKNGINDPNLLPKVAILDPQFLTSLPAKIAAETGMDALSHLIEAYVSKGSNLMTDALAVEGIRLCGKYMLPFVADRGNKVAAEKMSFAAMLGGIVISYARTGGAHTLTRPIVTGVSHGLSTGLVLPYVMEFNIISNPEKFVKIAEALGEKIEGNVMEDAQKSVTAVRRIMQLLSFPIKLNQIGINESDIPELAKMAYKLDVSRLNPRELTVDAIESILRAAL